eukprot:scaffold89555_cov26-Tisochrysis_lutea.AAC.2
MQAPLHTHSLKLNPSRPCTRDPNPQSTRVRCGGPAPHHTGKLLRPFPLHSVHTANHLHGVSVKLLAIGTVEIREANRELKPSAGTNWIL